MIGMIFGEILNFCKVWWHCLTRLPQDGHSMCRIQQGPLNRFHFCECGYQNNGVTWDQMQELVK